MAAIAWTPQLEIGIPFIDGDHKILVKLLNQVDDAIAAFEESATLASVLGALSDYTVYHFDREEAMLQACGYDGLVRHRDEHALLSGQVADIGRRFHADPASVNGREVRDFLRHWLIEHILAHDFSYRTIALAAPHAARRAEALHFAHSVGVRQNGFASLRVLVVDDSPRFRAFLATVLKALGVRDVMLAASAEEGLDRWNKRPGDAILCDWLMNGMPAHVFVAAARVTSPGARIVALSALAPDAIARQAGAGTLDAILEKPVATADLARALAGGPRAPTAGGTPPS